MSSGRRLPYYYETHSVNSQCVIFSVCCQATAAIQRVFRNLSFVISIGLTGRKRRKRADRKAWRQGATPNTKCNSILMTLQHMRNRIQNSMRQSVTKTILLWWISSHKVAAADATQWVGFTCAHLAKPFMQSDLQVRYNASRGSRSLWQTCYSYTWLHF